MHNKVNILFIPSGGDLKKCALKMFPKVFTRKELEFFTQQDKKEQGRMSWIVKINNKGIKLGMITVTVKSNSWYGTGSSWTQSHDMHDISTVTICKWAEDKVNENRQFLAKVEWNVKQLHRRNLIHLVYLTHSPVKRMFFPNVMGYPAFAWDSVFKLVFPWKQM